jgi:hypothetical protein
MFKFILGALMALSLAACTAGGVVDTSKLPQPPVVLVDTTTAPTDMSNKVLCDNIKAVEAYKAQWLAAYGPIAALFDVDLNKMNKKLNKMLKVAEARDLACGK